MLPSPADVISAGYRLRGVIERTPLVRSSALSDHAGTDVYLKCENVQRTGSFKLRGAYTALAALPPEVRQRGVVASSAGNHGLGLALSAQLLGVRAVVFVPANAPAVKRDGILRHGAEVNQTQPDYDAAHAAAIAYASAMDMTFVNPCAGEPLLAGQGTVALEIIEELPGLRTIIVPVGGGGLVGGIGAFLRAVAPAVRIVGAQTEHTNAMAASLSAGQRVDIDLHPTIADGLAGQVDDEGYAIGRLTIDEMCVVTEEDAAGAVARAWTEHQLRLEGSGAVGVAALLAASPSAFEGPIVVVISGGNIDDARFQSLTTP